MSRKVLAAALAIPASLAVLSPPPARADVSFPLFDGRSLSGWTVMGDAKFSVAGGCLQLDGGVGWLRTDGRYRDFVLTVEWRALAPGYDSGIFFRAPLEGKPWPKGYQVNLADVEVGRLVGVDGAGGPTPPYVKPQGEWNRFELTVKGVEAALRVNGVEAWRTRSIEDRDGAIGIQAENHRFQFRDIRIVETGYADLAEGFDGKAGAHLEVRGPGAWEARPGGLLVNSGEGGGWIGTRTADWADFIVKLDYRVPANGNSGVYIRRPPARARGPQGLEIQIIDDDATRWQLKDVQHSGSIYGAVPPRVRATRAAGTWEAMEVAARGSRIEVHVNGVPVIDEDLERVAEKAGKKSIAGPREGCIGLQSYGTGIEFRNFRARRLAAAAPAAGASRIADRAACSSLCQCKQPAEKAFATIAAMGYRKIDLSCMSWAKHADPAALVSDFEKEAGRVEAALRASGLSVANLTYDAVDSKPFDVWGREFAAVVKLAARLRAPLINLMAPAAGAGRKAMVERLREAVGVAKAAGIILTVETHTGQITERPKDALWLCGEVPGLGLTLDPSHYYAGPNQGAPFDELYPLARGTGLRAGGMSWAEVQLPWGEGPIDFVQVVRKLEAAGYRGAYVAEYIEGHNAVDPLAESRKFLEWIRGM